MAIAVRSSALSPSKLIEYAKTVRQRDPDGFDEAWCVFDVDDYAEDIANAIPTAKRAKISLAISNPCFEFWLLLHFADHSAWLNGPNAVKAQLCRHISGYDKTKIDFAAFAPRISDAIERGRRLTDAGHTHPDNPSTTMWQLASTIVGT